MTLRDWVLFIFTFIVGILGGMYLYLTSFVPEYIYNPAVTEIIDEQKDRLQITAEQYGGCAMAGSCRAFSLTGNRHYRYQPAAVRNVAENIETGNVPRALFSYVAQVIDEADVAAIASPTQKTCRSWVDGIDERYEIIREGKEYILDTCTTRLEFGSPLHNALSELYVYMEYPDEYELPPEAASGGLGGIIEGVLEESFQE